MKKLFFNKVKFKKAQVTLIKYMGTITGWLLLISIKNIFRLGDDVFMQTQNDPSFCIYLFKTQRLKGKVFTYMKISRIGSPREIREIKMHAKCSCFTVYLFFSSKLYSLTSHDC